MLSFAKLFCSIYWDESVIFVLASVHVLYCIYLFEYLEPSSHLWKNNLIMVYDLFNVLLNSVYKYFIENFFYLYSPRKLVYNFFILPFWVFLYQGNTGFIELSLVAFLPFLLYGIVWGALVSFFKVLAEFGRESIWSWAIFVGRLLQPHYLL
jgi:hypothetical protein